MDAQSMQVVMEHLDKIAVNLGLGAGEIFSWYVKQVYLQGFGSILLAGFFVILAIFSWYKTFKHEKKLKEESKNKEKEEGKEEEEVGNEGMIWVCLITTALFIIFGIVAIINTFQMFNAKYYAFNDLLSKIM